MAYEILLGVAGLAVAGVIALAAVEIPRWRKATPGYQPRHTAEQPAAAAPAVHVGATEAWSPMQTIGRPPPVDARVQLTNALAQAEHWQRAADQLRAQIAAEDAQRVHRDLDQMERQFKDRLRRAGHQLVKTQEFRRADIRRIARSGDAR